MKSPKRVLSTITSSLLRNPLSPLKQGPSFWIACCTTKSAADSNRKSKRLDGVDEHTIPHPLPNDELGQLHYGAEELTDACRPLQRALCQTDLAITAASQCCPHNSALMQLVLDAAQSERESCVRHHRQADDLWARHKVTERGTIGHLSRLSSRSDRLKKSSSDNIRQSVWSHSAPT
jgi:hypothetical protein